MNAAEFIAGVGKLAAKSDSDLKDKPLEATCWYIAYGQAMCIFDLTTKDVARELVAGWGPYYTEIHVQEWLDAIDPDEVKDELVSVAEFYPPKVVVTTKITDEETERLDKVLRGISDV